MNQETIRLKRGQCERVIREALIKFANDTGKRIEQVNIDTRNFANYATEIFLEGE